MLFLVVVKCGEQCFFALNETVFPELNALPKENAMAKSFTAQQNKTQGSLFRFPRSVEKQAIIRQGSCCAICNTGGNIKSLTGHHVIPVRHGCPSKNDPNYAFLNTVENCVMICKSCHISKAHGGHWAYGVLAGPEGFPNSHGSNTAAHKKWVSVLKSKEKKVCLFWKMSRKKK